MNENNNNLIPEQLMLLINENKVPHAIVLEGHDKKTLNVAAQQLAMWAVCKSTNRPCFNCNACLKVQRSTHPDVYIAKPDGKKNTVKIAEIRSICMDSVFMPNESDCKVYIIPESDRMEAAPQNAILKLIEEPPQPILFILLCENVSGLLQTIRSRCSVFKVDRPAETNKEVDSLVKNIVRALCQKNESELMYACSELNDRQTSIDVLNRLSDIAADSAVYAITGKISSPNDDMVKELSLNIKKRGLIQIQNSILKISDYIKGNVNLQLVGTVLSANLKYCKYM